MIEAIELCKQFERSVRRGRRTGKETFLAVDHVSLRAYPGEIVGILGPNGAGKTTLLRMLGRLMTPTGGYVRLTDADGAVITDEIRQKAAIGYLSGNTKLYPRFSIREYLRFLGELYGLDRAQIRSRTEEISRVLDMETFLDNRIEKLSTGQTQRASIARCLMADPQIYILDEPTLGLDVLSAEAIICFMKEQKEKGKTVLYSTHYLEEAQMLCDRVCMLCDGRIAAQGTPAELTGRTGTVSLRGAFHAVYENYLAGKIPAEISAEDSSYHGGGRRAPGNAMGQIPGANQKEDHGRNQGPAGKSRRDSEGGASA